MPVPLRTDFNAAALRTIARRTKDGPQARRLLALAAIYEGATRTEAARIGGVTLQIVRDWVVKFNAHGPEGLVNRKPPGQPSKLTDAHRVALQAIVEQGPIPAIHGVVRWRLIDLIQWLWEEFRITISKQTLSRELRAMNYRKLSARPRHHAKNEAAVAAFKKLPGPSGGDRTDGGWQALRDLVCGRGPGGPEEQDHAALGQTGHPPFSPERSANPVGLHLRRDLSGGGERRGSRPPPVYDRGHEPAPRRDLTGGRAWRACPRPGGSGGLASVEETCGARQHHPHAAPVQGTRVEPGGEHLAVHAGELDLEPDLRRLQRHPRSLLRGVEQAHRSALAHYVYRPARLDLPVLISGTWY